MSKSLRLVLLIALVVILLAGGILVAYRQKAKKQLQNQTTGVSPATSQINDQLLAPKVKALEASISESVKDITGKVTGISGKTLTVEADIVDFSKLAGLEEDALSGPYNSLPQTKKQFKVSISDKTDILAKNISQIPVGTLVNVFVNELVYKTSDLTAAKVILLSGSEPKVNLRDIKQVGGIAKEVSGESLTLEVNLVDYSKIDDPANLDIKTAPKIKKTYKVLIDSKTEFPDKKLQDIKVGDAVEAFSAQPVFDLSQFTATKIVSPIPTPSAKE